MNINLYVPSNKKDEDWKLLKVLKGIEKKIRKIMVIEYKNKYFVKGWTNREYYENGKIKNVTAIFHQYNCLKLRG